MTELGLEPISSFIYKLFCEFGSNKKTQPDELSFFVFWLTLRGTSRSMAQKFVGPGSRTKLEKAVFSYREKNQ